MLKEAKKEVGSVVIPPDLQKRLETEFGIFNLATTGVTVLVNDRGFQGKQLVPTKIPGKFTETLINIPYGTIIFTEEDSDKISEIQDAAGGIKNKKRLAVTVNDKNLFINRDDLRNLVKAVTHKTAENTLKITIPTQQITSTTPTRFITSKNEKGGTDFVGRRLQTDNSIVMIYQTKPGADEPIPGTGKFIIEKPVENKDVFVVPLGKKIAFYASEEKKPGEKTGSLPEFTVIKIDEDAVEEFEENVKKQPHVVVLLIPTKPKQQQTTAETRLINDIRNILNEAPVKPRARHKGGVGPGNPPPGKAQQPQPQQQPTTQQPQPQQQPDAPQSEVQQPQPQQSQQQPQQQQPATPAPAPKYDIKTAYLSYRTLRQLTSPNFVQTDVPIYSSKSQKVGAAVSGVAGKIGSAIKAAGEQTGIRGVNNPLLGAITTGVKGAAEAVTKKSANEQRSWKFAKFLKKRNII